MINIRPEKVNDYKPIRKILLNCFQTPAEANLVELLRAGKHLSISLVVETGEEVIGHIAFSPVTTSGGSPGFGLAPLAILPGNRRQGLAARLVEHGLMMCKVMDFGWGVVLGDPHYYSRFGFRPASEFGLEDEYGGGPVFQALELVPGKLPVGAGQVRYSPEFTSLGAGH